MSGRREVKKIMNEPSFIQVVLMGLITVFVVLICLIIIIKIMGAIVTKATGKNAPQAVPAPAAAPVPAVPAAQSALPNKQQLVAVIAAAVAEEMGADVNHLKIHSIRKL